MLELKNYQTRALETFDRWLDALRTAEKESDSRREVLQKARIEMSEADKNYPKKAWEQLTANGGSTVNRAKYVDRTDGEHRPIPHICFKVPTGGGKTLLAASALERLQRQTGLTLWIVPTKAIYEQTKAALWDRAHPYRQTLERASGGRVKMLEKEDTFNRDDVANYLCVMLLMLPAANKPPEKKLKDKAYYRMYRDSGRYPSFFPDVDDIIGNRELLKVYKKLTCRTESGLIIQNLFNVFKMLRPVVVLDEAHKAYGTTRKSSNTQFVKSISRLAPSMVIELSATPNPGISNLLLDISGRDLKKEEMIKLPVNVASFPNAEWQTTLLQAAEELEKLDAEAKSLENNSGRYIRPIAVVRVERTGKDQRDAGKIHAEDVRDYLEQNLHVPKDAIRVKSAVNDELKGEQLLSEYSPVKWIITKSALMEGWDCSFAYLLVILDNTQAKTAITQLLGRVMRQPHAQVTRRESLDQCYVYCHDPGVGDVVEMVKTGLQAEGLNDLRDQVSSTTGDIETKAVRTTVKRRSKHRGKDIFLPLVLHSHGASWIQLDYHRHILPQIDWSIIGTPDPQLTTSALAAKKSWEIGLDEDPLVSHEDVQLEIDKSIKISQFSRHLSDIVPNSWQAAHLVKLLVEREKNSGKSGEAIYDRRKYLTQLLREHVKKQVETQAEVVFRRKLNQGEIRFDLETGQPRYEMATSFEIFVSPNEPLLTNHHKAVQLSLFKPVFSDQFDNDLEKQFAYYLDEQCALRWWHRVAARQHGEYHLQGWRQDRIYPDFVAISSGGDDETRVLVFDTKGEHLGGNQDTEYKRKVLETLEGAFNSAGTIKLHEGTTIKGVFQLVFEKHLETNFAEITPRLTAEL